MIANHDILCILGTAWDDHWGTAQQIMSRLAEYNRVLVLELPISPLSPLTPLHKGTWVRQLRRWRQTDRPGEIPNLTIVSPPPVFPFRYHKLTNYLTQKILLHSLDSANKRHGYKDPLIITFQADSGAMIQSINARPKIYFCLDDWSASGRWCQPAGKVREREMELVHGCDLILATSRRLESRLGKSGKPTFLIPNAADYDLFSQSQRVEPSKEVSGLQRPVIGFVGMITPHSFDVELMVWLAERHPGWSFVIVGKKLAADPDLRRLQQLPNVFFFGFQPMEMLPKYLAGMDVCLIPLRQTEWIKSAFSLKLFEYLAAGKPVVATWTEELLPYRDLIHMSRSHVDFEQGIVKSLEKNTAELIRRRTALARRNTWDERVEQCSTIIQRFLDGTPESGDRAENGRRPSMTTQMPVDQVEPTVSNVQNRELSNPIKYGNSVAPGRGANRMQLHSPNTFQHDHGFTMALVSVVVCTFNRAEMLQSALVSLCGQEIRGIKFEIVVVDDGSTDSTASVVSRQQDASAVAVRYVRQEHSGVAVARNRGVTEAKGDWIAFFDDDQVAEKNWLARLTEKALQKRADCVGGPCLLRLPVGCDSKLDPTIRRLLGEEPLMMKERSSVDAGVNPLRSQPIPGTGNVLVKRALFDEIGLFSAHRSCGEDREFFKKAMKAGARLAVAPAAIVYHIVPLRRLTENYLLQTATDGGKSQAEIDDYREALWRAALRLGHLFIVTVPRLAYALLLRNRASALGRKCSIRFSMEYIAVALRRGKRQDISIPKVCG